MILPDASGRKTVKVEIDRPLDWGAVTDHAEFFGEMGICKEGYLTSVPDALRYSFECKLLNGFPWQFKALPDNGGQYEASGLGFQILVSPNLGPSSFNTHLPLCDNNKGECEAAELAVWDEMRAAAEAAYDRTDECKFTSFPAYEVTSTPLGTTWHRNVIFRNDQVGIEPPLRQ
ncbi:MAG: DUF3604 domain-containing protein [Gammaproteobacteria bacterium]